MSKPFICFSIPNLSDISKSQSLSLDPLQLLTQNLQPLKESQLKKEWHIPFQIPGFWFLKKSLLSRTLYHLGCLKWLSKLFELKVLFLLCQDYFLSFPLFPIVGFRSLAGSELLWVENLYPEICRISPKDCRILPRSMAEFQANIWYEVTGRMGFNETVEVEWNMKILLCLLDTW